MLRMFGRGAKALFALLAVAALTLPAAMAQDTRSVEVKFPRGSNGTTVSDTIVGYQAVNYRIGVSAGQRMSVQLDTDNTSNYFNVTGLGASEALFNGSVSGNSTSFVIPSSGTYVLNVYLMRNAARRGESADYDLTIYVENAAAQAPRPTTLPSGPVAPIPVGNLEAGPDYWQVQGLGSQPLNVRSGPSTSYGVIGTVHDGDRLANFGCTTVGGTRWCQVQTPRGQRGWVAGRYLHDSFNRPTTLPSVAPRPLPQPIPVQPNPTPDALSISQMPRYCAGEASAQFGVRPQDITVNMAWQSGNRYVTQGFFDRDGSSTFFNCWFNLDGTFQSLS